MTNLERKGASILRNHFLFLLLIFSVLLCTGCLGLFPPGLTPKPPVLENKGSLTGLVYDSLSGLALWSGTVTIADQSAPIKGGSFQIENIAPGTYTLRISKPFYQPLEKKVVIPNSNTTLTSWKLTPSFTSGELDLLARLVHAEAKGECYEGQVAVAATVLNRILDPNYPNTLNGVIYQVVEVGGIKYYQYEPVLNGTILAPADATAKKAVLDALAGWDPSLGATGFFAPALVGPNSWVRTRPSTIDIGGHRFFK